jgi:hypothetical protein
MWLVIVTLIVMAFPLIIATMRSLSAGLSQFILHFRHMISAGRSCSFYPPLSDFIRAQLFFSICTWETSKIRTGEIPLRILR